jgi:hypothetical protein
LLANYGCHGNMEIWKEFFCVAHGDAKKTKEKRNEENWISIFAEIQKHCFIKELYMLQ